MKDTFKGAFKSGQPSLGRCDAASELANVSELCSRGTPTAHIFDLFLIKHTWFNLLAGQ